MIEFKAYIKKGERRLMLYVSKEAVENIKNYTGDYCKIINKLGSCLPVDIHIDVDDVKKIFTQNEINYDDFSKAMTHYYYNTLKEFINDKSNYVIPIVNTIVDNTSPEDIIPTLVNISRFLDHIQMDKKLHGIWELYTHRNCIS